MVTDDHEIGMAGEAAYVREDLEAVAVQANNSAPTS
jgi:hypothetical protein